MAASWIITIGFVICLGIVGWIFTHFVNVAFDKTDSKRIDPLPKNEENTDNQN